MPLRPKSGSHSFASPKVPDASELPGALAQSLCRLESVAVVSAAMSADSLEAFDRLCIEANGVFGDAAGTREKRLRSLTALRARGKHTRHSMIEVSKVPGWARGRLPASTVAVADCDVKLPLAVKSAVDAVLLAQKAPPAPGFGSWTEPALELDAAPLAGFHDPASNGRV